MTRPPSRRWSRSSNRRPERSPRGRYTAFRVTVRDPDDHLTRDNAIGRSTGYEYPHEGGHRCARRPRAGPARGVAGADLWWSGKHDNRGGNVQVVTVADPRRSGDLDYKDESGTITVAFKKPEGLPARPCPAAAHSPTKRPASDRRTRQYGGRTRSHRHYAGHQRSDHCPSAAYCLVMPVIEAQCASILVPHDHRHINHERTSCR
jgi:hypothetical protein